MDIKTIVIEDNSVHRHAIAEFLNRDPHITSVEASTLIEGARLAMNEPRVLLLVDLTVPVGDGVSITSGTEVLEVMQRMIPGATRVVITGDTEAVAACLKAGAHAVIIKGTAESYGDGLIRTLQKAVLTHETELLVTPVKESSERIQQIVDMARLKLTDSRPAGK